MFGNSERLGAKARIVAAGAAAFAAVGLAACTTSIGGPGATPTKTVTQEASTGQAAAASSPAATHKGSAGTSHGSAHKSSGSADASAGGKLPEYQPSSVVSKSGHSTVLTSPDSVSKVGAFYQRALAAGGWHVVSGSTGSYHASFTAYRGHEGASISVYFRAGGSGISISTHPR